jgi:L-threonylcarbamoyladenylate synthase
MVVKVMNVYVYPTDTVWGIGASINDEASVREVSRIKDSGSQKQTSILFPSVTDLRDWVNLDFSTPWLEQFFKLETTLLVPLTFCTKKIPAWVVGDGPLVGVRVLEYEWLANLYTENKYPITSTSLNKSGKAPILELKEAKDFVDKYCSKCKFIKEEVALSGRASTIISYRPQLETTWDFIRRGSNVEKVQEHVELLST